MPVRPPNFRHFNAETAEANAATSEEVLEPVPEEFAPEAPVLSQDPLF